jgi:hypothetical protein
LFCVLLGNNAFDVSHAHWQRRLLGIGAVIAFEKNVAWGRQASASLAFVCSWLLLSYLL